MTPGKKDKEEEDGPSRAVIHRYKNRLSIIKNGKQAYKNKEYANSLRHYNTYLMILADYMQVDVQKLHPSFFDEKKDGGEIFLVSHVYWDLCKLYDRSSNFSGELEHCMKQFVKFSMGNKFQSLNASMVRKYTKGGLARNKEKFESTYKQMFVQNRKCYIATHCFTESHQVTNQLRSFRNVLVHYRWGQFFTEWYYHLSPQYITWLKRHPRIDIIVTRWFTRPLLKCLAYSLEKFKIIR